MDHTFRSLAMIAVVALTACGPDASGPSAEPPTSEDVYPAAAAWLAENGGKGFLPKEPVLIVYDGPDVADPRWWCEDDLGSAGCGDEIAFPEGPFSDEMKAGIRAALEPMGGNVRFHGDLDEIFEMVGNAHDGVEGTVKDASLISFGEAYVEGEDLVLTIGCNECGTNAWMVRMSFDGEHWAVAEIYWSAMQ